MNSVVSRASLYFIGMGTLSMLIWGGCAGRAPMKTSPPPEMRPAVDSIIEHLQGVWESPGRNGSIKKMAFEAGGRLTFQGGLEFFNPGQWELRPGQQELQITFPEAEDDKLRIFQLYLKDGVKDFDRSQKKITYYFDRDTWNLNVAGWVYTKADEKVKESSPAEPVFK
jgi:hypothetical protein